VGLRAGSVGQAEFVAPPAGGDPNPNPALDEANEAAKAERERAGKKKRYPSYIPSRAFSRAVLDGVLEIWQLPSTQLADAIPATPAGPAGPPAATPPATPATTNDRVMVVVKSGEGFPTSRDFDALIEDEKFHVHAEDSTPTRWSATRTDPTRAHAIDAPVSLVATQAPDEQALFAQLEAALATIHLPDSLKTPLQTFLKQANHNLGQWRAQVEGWFDDKMDRLSGWYKRRTQLILFVIGLVLVFTLNADTLLFARTIWRDASLRDAITAQAQKFSQSPVCQDSEATKNNPATCVTTILDKVKALNIPLGWSNKPGDPRHPNDGSDWWLKIVGLVLTAVALTLGAPFWFDLLNKFVNFRATGPPPAPTPATSGATSSSTT
jgi:hypothetical protein